jgi:hypothetical protein
MFYPTVRESPDQNVRMCLVFISITGTPEAATRGLYYVLLDYLMMMLNV